MVFFCLQTFVDPAYKLILLHPRIKALTARFMESKGDYAETVDRAKTVQATVVAMARLIITVAIFGR